MIIIIIIIELKNSTWPYLIDHILVKSNVLNERPKAKRLAGGALRVETGVTAIDVIDVSCVVSYNISV